MKLTLRDVRKRRREKERGEGSETEGKQREVFESCVPDIPEVHSVFILP